MKKNVQEEKFLEELKLLRAEGKMSEDEIESLILDFISSQRNEFDQLYNITTYEIVLEFDDGDNRRGLKEQTIIKPKERFNDVEVELHDGTKRIIKIEWDNAIRHVFPSFDPSPYPDIDGIMIGYTEKPNIPLIIELEFCNLYYPSIEYYRMFNVVGMRQIKENQDWELYGRLMDGLHCLAFDCEYNRLFYTNRHESELKSYFKIIDPE